jgi:ferredoxin
VVGELFVAFLAEHDDERWLRAIDRIAASIHPVDRAATRIWFHFFPMALQRAMERPDAADLARRMTLAGRWRLADQIHTGHAFLYGHRYWPQAHAATLAYADEAPSSLDLGAQIHEIARRVSAAAGAPESLVLGVSAVALRTLQQVGAERMATSTGEAATRPAISADAVVHARAREAAGGVLGLFGVKRPPEVVFDEQRADASFALVPSQHLATAAALDTRPHRALDPRCSEGPIPVHCRSCSCGTCWVGVLGGAEALSPIDGRERDKLAECGVIVEGSHPVMRLACMAQAHGRTTLVIPPWNGLVGRVLKPGR